MASTIKEGVVAKHPHGFGFVKTGQVGEEDVYVPAQDLVGVLDGDRVRVELVRRRGRMAGRLVEVVERRRQQVIGTYRHKRRADIVEPLDPTLDAVRVTVGCTPPPKDGEVVKVRLTAWPTEDTLAEGECFEVVGPADDPMHEVLSVAYGHGFNDGFPEEVRAQAAGVPDRVRVEDIAGRRDLRELPLVTIDGADARDFDDAVFAERIPGGGYRLVVAIADVAHYVREGTPLDREALGRGTSVYFPNKVLPMLPEALSNGICSLNPDVDRLCMVADLTMTEAGKTVNTELYEAVMRSHARLTYEEVAVMMGEREGEVRDAHRFWQARHLSPAVELSKKLNARRAERGSIDLDVPESFVTLGEDHLPVRIAPRGRLWAHRLIEEFMLAANEAVAYFFGVRGLPTIYRIHDEPDEAKLAAFVALARAHGFALTTGDDVGPKVLNSLLVKAAGRPEARALNHLLLRSMQQAMYSAENIGHYGLGATHYLHFTSPIRRYPDLMVHRLLKRHFGRAGRTFDGEARERLEEELDRVAVQSSERERAALDAEREVDAYFACLYMRDRVGEAFDAAVTSVVDFGLFVQLKGHFVEGLVKAEHLGSRFDYDAERLRLVYGDGRSFTIGDELRVTCTSVNVARRQIDFEPEGGEAPRPRRRPSEAPPKREAEKRETKKRASRASQKAPKRGGARKKAPRKKAPGRSARGPRKGPKRGR